MIEMEKNTVSTTQRGRENEYENITTVTSVTLLQKGKQRGKNQLYHNVVCQSGQTLGRILSNNKK